MDPPGNRVSIAQHIGWSSQGLHGRVPDQRHGFHFQGGRLLDGPYGNHRLLSQRLGGWDRD